MKILQSASVIPLLLLIFLFGVFETAQASEEKMSKPFPALSVERIDTKSIWKSEELKGKVSFVTLYADWCRSCIAEPKEIVALKKDFPSLNVVGVSYDASPEAAELWTYVYDKIHGKVLHVSLMDTHGKINSALGTRSIPTSVLVDAQGIIRYQFTGAITEENRGSYHDKIQEIFSQDSNAP